METDTSSATAEAAPGTEEAPDAATASTENNPEGGNEGASASETAEETAARVAGKDDSTTKPPPRPKAKIKLGEREWDEDELAKRLAIADKSDEHYKTVAQRHEEAQKLKAQTDRLFDALTKDPVGTLRYLRSQGLLTKDVEDYAEQVLRDATEDASLTPEQRQARDERRELEQLRAEQRDSKAKREQAQATERQAQFEKTLDNDMKSVFEESGVPKSLYQMRRVGAFMLAATERGIPYSKELIQHGVRQSISELQTEVTYLAENMSADQLVRQFPKLADKLRKAAVAQVLTGSKGAPPNAGNVGRPAPGAKPPPTQKPSAGPAIKSFKDFRDQYLTPEQ